MKNLEAIIAKYYFPNELFVSQVTEIIDLLTERLAWYFPHDQAVDKANDIVTKYYLNACMQDKGDSGEKNRSSINLWL